MNRPKNVQINNNLTRKRKRGVSKDRQRCNPMKKWKVTPHLGRLLPDDRDIICRLDDSTSHIVEHIFSYLDYDSLVNAEKVSPEWQEILRNERIWKILFKRNVHQDITWRKIFNVVRRSPGLSTTDNDDALMSRRICKEVGYLRNQYISLISSSVSLLSSSVKLLSKVLHMLKLVGFGDTVPSVVGESDDSDDD